MFGATLRRSAASLTRRYSAAFGMEWFSAKNRTVLTVADNLTKTTRVLTATAIVLDALGESQGIALAIVERVAWTSDVQRDVRSGRMASCSLRYFGKLNQPNRAYRAEVGPVKTSRTSTL